MAKAKVVDARSALVIHITKTDVRKGALKDAKTCAAAQSICRQDGIEAAQVYIGRTYVKKAGKWIRYATPPSLRNEIIAFDRGGEFEPGDYTLNPVQPVVQYKNRRERAEYMKEYNKRPKRNRKRGRVHVVSNIRKRAGLGPDLSGE